MSQPIVVTLPHQLGKAEALRRLQASFSNAQSSSGSLLVFKNQWSDNHLDFHASLLGQNTSGTVDVAEDHVRLGGSTPLVALNASQQGKGIGGKAGEADAGEAGQALQCAKMTIQIPARQEDHADFERRVPLKAPIFGRPTNFSSPYYTDRGTLDRLGAAFARSEVVEAPYGTST